MRGLLWSKIVVWRVGLERDQRMKFLISDALLHSEKTLAGVGVGDVCGCGGCV